MVGYKVVFDDNEEIISREILSKNNIENYGLQSNKTTISMDSEGTFAGTTQYGLISFSFQGVNPSNDTWGYWTDVNGNLLEKYGNTYPAYVYDENSNFYEPIENYKKYFNDKLNKKVNEIRPITYEELVALGCDASNEICSTDEVINNNLEWIYNSAYYTASLESRNLIYVVLPSSEGRTGYFSGNDTPLDNEEDEMFDLRPVIEINKSDI